MAALALMLLLGGWVLLYSGLFNKRIGDQLRFVFGG